MSRTEKPRILLITRNFPPLTGGMERLMFHLVTGLCEWADLTVVGPKGCAQHCPPGVKVYECPTGLAGFLIFATLQGTRAHAAARFDLILGGSGLAAPVLALLRLFFGGKTVVFLHGLDLVVENYFYQRIFLPSIAKSDLIISNSNNTKRIAIGMGVKSEKVTVINPGTELPDISQVQGRSAFCKRHDIHFRKIVLFVGRMTKRKGLSVFIEQCMPLILAEASEVGLIVVGDNPSQGLTSFGEREQVVRTVEHEGLEERIRFLGQLEDEDLWACYAAADVQVFPLIDMPGDVEGFGMVAVEAAACGTPTVAFDVGGVGDAINSANGYLVPAGEYRKFSQAVLQVLDSGSPAQECCIAHARQFSWDKHSEQIKSALGVLATGSDT